MKLNTLTFRKALDCCFLIYLISSWEPPKCLTKEEWTTQIQSLPLTIEFTSCLETWIWHLQLTQSPEKCELKPSNWSFGCFFSAFQVEVFLPTYRLTPDFTSWHRKHSEHLFFLSSSAPRRGQLLSACEVWPFSDFMFPCYSCFVANISAHRLADSPPRATETTSWVGNYLHLMVQCRPSNNLFFFLLRIVELHEKSITYLLPDGNVSKKFHLKGTLSRQFGPFRNF